MRALSVRVGAFGLGHLTRVPPGSTNSPWHHMLEPAEDGAPLPSRLIRAIAVARLDGLAAPGARFSRHHAHLHVLDSRLAALIDILVASPSMEPLRIVALDGDETGQELLEQSLRVLDPGVLGTEIEVERFDL